MESSGYNRPTKSAALDFYNSYLTVIYGLLAGNGLTYVVTFASPPNNNKWTLLNAFLFFGTFVTSLRLWFASAIVDDLSQRFYRSLAKRRDWRFDVCLLMDTGAATTFAGFLLAMFLAIPAEQTRFFLWFLEVAAISLAYDFYARRIASVASKFPHDKSDQEVIKTYSGQVSIWTKQDVVFLLGAAILYFLHTQGGLRNSTTLGVTFAVFSVVLLLMDIGLLPPYSKVPTFNVD